MEAPVVRGSRDTERFLTGAEPPAGLRSDDAIDLRKFLATRGDHDRFHGEERRVNYALSGAVVHFFLLHRGGAVRRGFIRYAREAYRNTLPESPTELDQLYEYLGGTERTLQAAWEEFNRAPDLFDF